MYVKIIMESLNGSEIKLPFYYQRDIQGLIYKSIEKPEFADFLHNRGYQFEKRKFKLFSFSQIMGKPSEIDKKRKEFYFGSSVSIVVSTVNNNLLNSLENLINKDSLTFGGNKIIVVQVRMYPYKAGNEEKVTTLSPVCCYSTVQVPGKGKRTIFYHPYEKDFAQIAKLNLLHKFQAYYHKLPENTDFSIHALSRPVERIMCYKGFLTKGYSGDFLLSGSPQLIQMALETGLCSKGSMGQGLIVPKKLLEAV